MDTDRKASIMSLPLTIFLFCVAVTEGYNCVSPITAEKTNVESNNKVVTTAPDLVVVAVLNS